MSTRIETAPTQEYSYPLPSGINIHLGRRIRQTQQWTGIADISRGLADEIPLEVLIA